MTSYPFFNAADIGVPSDPNDLFSQFDTGTGNLLPKLLLHFPRSRTLESPYFSIPKGGLDQDEDIQLDSADPRDILSSKILKHGSLDTDKSKSFLPPISSIQSVLGQSSESAMTEYEFKNPEHDLDERLKMGSHCMAKTLRQLVHAE